MREHINIHQGLFILKKQICLVDSEEQWRLLIIWNIIYMLYVFGHFNKIIHPTQSIRKEKDRSNILLGFQGPLFANLIKLSGG